MDHIRPTQNTHENGNVYCQYYRFFWYSKFSKKLKEIDFLRKTHYSDRPVKGFLERSSLCGQIFTK